MTIQLADTGQATIGDLLAVGVHLEAAAQCFYQGLAEMFRHAPEVADFWRRFAEDEALHGKRLIELRASMSDTRLSEPTDAMMLEAGRKLLIPPLEDRLREVRSLDDAYEMAHDLETSETNTIFRFFITEFSQDRRIITAIMHHLDGHVERLMAGLPAQYATRAGRVELEAMRS
jgi:rubrerythrin